MKNLRQDFDAVPTDVLLDVDVEDRRPWNGCQHVGEAGNRELCEGGRRQPTRARANALDALEGLVVQEHGLAIARDSDVELDSVATWQLGAGQ